MKRICLFILFILFLAIPAHATDITFAWDANTEPVDGYRIYCSKQSGSYVYGGAASANFLWEGTATTATVTVTECGKHYFVATAYCVDSVNGTVHESGPSNEKDCVVKPHDVKNFR